MNEKVEIKDLSDIELKALVYDEMLKIQISQNNITLINQELNLRREKINVDNV